MVAGLCSACMIGPRHVVPEVVPPHTQVGMAPAVDSVLFDSLAQAAQVPAPGSGYDARATPPAWADILRDSTLAGLVQAALHNNRDIRTALGRVDEYRADIGEARSALLPEVDGAASYSKNQITFGSTPLQYDAWVVAGSLQWEIDFWGRIRQGVAAAEADRDARVDDENALVLTIVADVADAYLELLELRADLAISRQTLASRQSTLRLAQQRYAQGVISELDVRQFEADVAAAASSVAEYTRESAQREHTLSLLTGQPPGAEVIAGSLDSAVAAVAVPDSIPVALLLRRPDVASAERELAAADARIGAAQAARLPRVTITGEYGSQSVTASQLFGNGTAIYTAKAGVAVPLYTGGRLSADVGIARARAEQARSNYEQAVLTAMREVADALIGLRTERDQLAAQTAQAANLQDAYRLAERRYEGGIASYLEVLDAQRSLFTAQLAAMQSRRAYLEATVQLYKAIGGRWHTAP